MTSKAGRAANAIKSGTVAAGMAVGNTLAYVAPQLAGAIDIVVVKQPDGTLRSSPFYVRFGKYTGLRSEPTTVKVTVNDTAADFSMYLGRTGEAYFLVDVEPGDEEAYDSLNGLMSPASGYSSGEEAMSFAPVPQATALQEALEGRSLRNAASSPALPVSGQEELPTVTPGSVAYGDVARGENLAMRTPLDMTLSAPASLASPVCPVESDANAHTSHAEPARTLPPRRPSSEGGWGRNGRSSRRKSGTWARDEAGPDPWTKAGGWLGSSGDAAGNAPAAKNGAQAPSEAQPRSKVRRETSPGAVSQLTASLAASAEADEQRGLPQEPGAGQQPGREFTFSPRSSQSSDGYIREESMFSPPPHLRQGGARSPLSRQAAHGARLAGIPSQQRGSATPECSMQPSNGSWGRPPAHPWSVGNPRLLPTPLASQPQVAVISSADAAAPVQAAAAGPDPTALGGQTAILPRQSLDEIRTGDRYGNRMELEAIDHKVQHGKEAAPFAMAEARAEMRNWQQGGHSPRMPLPNKIIAQRVDSVAEEARLQSGTNSAVSTSTGEHQSLPQPRTIAAADLRDVLQAASPSSSDISSSDASSPLPSPFATEGRQESAGRSGLQPLQDSLPSPGAAKLLDARPSSGAVAVPLREGIRQIPQTSKAADAARLGTQDASAASSQGSHPAVPSCLSPGKQGDSRVPGVPGSPFSEPAAQADPAACSPSGQPCPKRPADKLPNGKPAASHPGGNEQRARPPGGADALDSAGPQQPSQSLTSDAKRERWAEGTIPDVFGSAIDLNDWHGHDSSSDRGDSPRLGSQQDEGHLTTGAESSSVRPLHLDTAADQEDLAPPPEPAVSPPFIGKRSSKSSQASDKTFTAATSLPIGIPGSSAMPTASPLSTSLPLADAVEEQPRGGSLPAGVFGMSPTEAATYLGNVAEGSHLREMRGLSLGDLSQGQGEGKSLEGRGPERLAALDGFELSLCASHLHAGVSPQDAWQAFQAGRISSAQMVEQGAALVGNPELVCRLGSLLVPWQKAAPAVLGVLAFGGSWDRLLPEDAGVVAALPEPPFAESAKKENEKRSSWRVWLGSWRSRRENSKSDLASVAAAAVEKADKAKWASPAGSVGGSPTRGDSTTQKGGKAGSQDLGGDPLEGMMQAGKRVPGKRRAFVPSTEQLASLSLAESQNTIEFTYGKQRLRAYLYFLRWNARLIISDVDGTITKSDLLGHVLPRVGFDWSHTGINRLFTNICANGYHILFLSSRAIAQASATRDYLHSLTQNGHKLPSGPVIISPDGLFPSLYRELVLRRPHEFKIRALEDIRALFPATCNPFFCGFGNRDTDEISYLTVGVPPSKIFIINPKGELRKASSTVVTSTWSSLTGINDLVNQMFPPVLDGTDKAADSSALTPEREEYNDYNFWHVAPPIVIDSDDEAFGEGGDGDDDYSEEEESSNEDLDA